MEVLIVGAGPSGIMAAIMAARNNNNVTLIDHNEKIGRKILSTGNGRCNISNEDMGFTHFHGKYPEYAKTIINQFDKKDTISFFEDIGLYIKNKNGYLYPYSEQASTVLDVLRFEIEKYYNINVLTDVNVTDAKKINDKFVLTSDKGEIKGNKLIIASGSCASSKLGSDGSGYGIAKGFGHSLIKPVPALTSLCSNEVFLKQIAGIRTETRISLYSDGKMLGSEYGELQINKDNISGIPVFQLSYLAGLELQKNRKIIALIDFLPNISEDILKEQLSFRIHNYGKRNASEFLIGYLHKNLSMLITKKCNIDINRRINSFTVSDVLNYVEVIKNFKVKICDINSFDNAQVCCGGVSTNELNDKLESKLVDGLYFVGEIIDINGDCGGYNLQWAFSSGAVCGGSIK